MGRQHSPQTLAALQFIEKNGSADYLEIERHIAPGALARISALRQEGYIEALPKERGQLKRYAVTPAGAKLLRSRVTAPTKRLTAFTMPVWVPPAHHIVRPGALDAFAIPSRGF